MRWYDFPMFSEDSILYEQPLNEVLRICLRLEYLFQQAGQYIHQESTWDSRAALAAMLDIINILDRPDLKTKLAKAMNQRMVALVQLGQAPNVDNKKLKEILNELDRFTVLLQSIPGKLGQALRENEFLNLLRLHFSKLGGATAFSLPAFYFWLQQPSEIRFRALTGWFKELEEIQKIITLLLQITRETAKPQLKFAKQGFYQESLDSAIPYQLIRIGLSIDRKIFPEISVGRYGLSIHFYSPNFEGRPVKAAHEIPFKLACCAI